jgi:uncharacterized protein YceH (UPF0502 family)
MNSSSDEGLRLDAIEARLLGCLIEKKALTPDVYPLTLNALQVAANQKTSRDPVMALEVAEIGQGLARLEKKGLARRVLGSRADRYEHRVAQTLGLANAQAALLGLLLLRGPQTFNELHTRSERMGVGSQDTLREELDLLIGHKPPLVVQLDRAPGQREERYAHLLAGPVDVETLFGASSSHRASPVGGLEERVRVLEEQVAALQEKVEALSRKA